MTLIKTLLVAGVGATVLSGCAAIDATRKLSDFEDSRTTVNDLSATATMPVSGSATYTGQSAIAGSFAGDTVVLLGDTEMTADFARSRISGKIDDLVGIELNERQRERYDNGDLGALALLRAAEKVDGEFAIRGGTIVGNTFAANTSGTANMSGYTYKVSGGIDGEFRGDDAAALKAEDGATFDFTRNGTSGTEVAAEIYATQ